MAKETKNLSCKTAGALKVAIKAVARTLGCCQDPLFYYTMIHFGHGSARTIMKTNTWELSHLPDLELTAKQPRSKLRIMM